jgi:hypothetical protein
MGYGATRSLERVAAAMGALEAAPLVFESARDVPQGGVLLALPALMAVGLLRHNEEYALPPGFYGLSSVMVLLALMALARIASIEQLRYAATGEWGNLLGLDRVPEVRTLREKLKLLCGEQGRAARWNAALAKEWIGQQETEQASGLAFYVDGHVRVYHGELSKLPRHYVPRERFYLRATVDYWVNALGGEPFCYFNQAVDHGLVQAMRGEVLPWLEANVSVSAEQEQRMAADPRVPRFTVIFDREGYSPDLFRELQPQRIAALTYHRYPDGEDWRVEEFQEQAVKLVSGETVRMKLAERGTHVGKRPGLWVREVRKLGTDGHQVSIVSTNFSGEAAAQAAALMARWSQENFFKYMREHFGLDALVQYGTEEIPATVTVLNPVWRELNRQVRQKQAECKSLQKLQQNVGLAQPLSEAAVRHYEQHQGQLQARIEQLQPALKQLQQQRKQTPRHIAVQDLPEPDRFTQLRTERKYFLDTIKMIAYRAETSMASTVREKLKRSDDARALLRQIYDTEADLMPDLEAKTLTVHLHHLTQAAHDTAVRYLCDELTTTETIFPGTDLRLVYKLGSS